jgi:hypothetical protein
MLGLMPADFPARENFHRCFLQRSADYFFVPSVLLTDEAHFGRDGIISIHNQHQWAEENRHDVIQSRHQQQFRINVRVGIVCDCLAGPDVFLHHLTGNHYRDCLLDDPPELHLSVALAVPVRGSLGGLNMPE